MPEGVEIDVICADKVWFNQPLDILHTIQEYFSQTEDEVIHFLKFFPYLVCPLYQYLLILYIHYFRRLNV